MKKLSFLILILASLFTFSCGQSSEYFPIETPPETQPLVANNIIMFIGDGMGPEHVKAASIYSYGTESGMFFQSFPVASNITTFCADNAVTDSAAAATAIATGHKVNYAVVSAALPGDGSELETILEYYKARGKSTGLVTTTYITHATPAAFGAHEPSRNNYSNIASDLLTGSKPDILFGGASYVTPTAAANAGYDVVTDLAQLMAINADSATMVSGQFGSGYLPYEYDWLGTLPHLSNMVSVGLDILDKDPDGFFLMVEGGRIDHASHSNDIIRTIYETVEFENSIRVAYQWAMDHPDTLIVVTADHETGGLTVTGNNGIGNLPSVTWSTTGHTATDVPVYAWGAGSAIIANVTDNTHFFNSITER